MSEPVLLIPPVSVASATDKTVASKSSKVPAAATVPSLTKAKLEAGFVTWATVPIVMGVPLPSIDIAAAEPNCEIELAPVLGARTFPSGSISSAAASVSNIPLPILPEISIAEPVLSKSSEPKSLEPLPCQDVQKLQFENLCFVLRLNW